jgi:O-antigen/teichoic acid export membrane protein
VEELEEARAVDVLASEEAGDRVIRGGTVRAASYVVGIGIGVLVTPLVVRHLGVEDFGRLATVTSLLFIVTGLTEGGLANVAVREYSTSDAARGRSLLANLVGLRLVLTGLGCLAAITFAIVAGYEHVQVYGTVIAALSIPLLGVQTSYAIPLTAGLRLGWLAGIDLLRQLVTSVGMLVLVIAGATLLPFFVIIPLAALAVLVLTVWLVRREALVRPRADRAEWKLLLRETGYYAAATAMAVLYFQLALIFVSLVTDARETGYYSVAFRIVDLANGVPWLVVTAAFPILARAAHDNRDRLRYALQRMFEVSLILGLWFSLSIGLGAKFAVEVVAGTSADPSIPVLRILGIGMTATFLIATWAFALLSVRDYRDLLAANLLAVAIQAGLTLPLAASHGARGAAIGAAITEYTLATCYGVSLMRRQRDLRIDTRPLPRVALALLVALALGLLGLLVHPVVAVVVATLTYFGLLLALRALPAEITQALARRPGGGSDMPTA